MAETLDNNVRFIGRRSMLPWLVGLALLALALFALVPYLMDKARVTSSIPAVQQQASVVTQSTSDAITSISQAQSDTNANGRSIVLDNVAVQSVVGDHTFVVVQNGQSMLAYLNPGLDEANAENKVVVKAGQNIRLSGTVSNQVKTDELKSKGFTQGEIDSITQAKTFLAVDSITQK